MTARSRAGKGPARWAVAAAARGHRRLPLAGAHRRPVPLAAAGLVALSLVAAGALELTGHGFWRSRDGRDDWRTVFDGYGRISYRGATISLEPATPAAEQETHAALTVSSRSYGDLAASMRVRTDRQLRRGKPNPWEVGWVLWHYSSPQHFYAVTLKTTGWELSKQDPDYPGGQRFLASGTVPTFPVGQWHTVGIVQIGNQIEVAANGRPLVRFVDSADPYLSGRVGLYTEDAQVRFTGFEFTPVPPSTPKGSTSP